MGKTDNVYIKKARKKRFIKKLISILIIIIVAFGIFLWKTTLFNLKNVEIKGDVFITKTYLQDEMETYMGESVVFLNKDDIIKKLKYNPYIKNISIKRKFPSTLALEVEEAKGLYYIYDGNNFNIISSDLTILEKANEIPDRQLIEIKGKDISGKELGEKIDQNDRVSKMLDEVYKECQVIKNNNENFNITALDILSLSSIKVYLGNVEVIIGSDENFRTKMSDAINIYKTGLVKQYINVSFEGTPDFK